MEFHALRRIPPPLAPPLKGEEDFLVFAYVAAASAPLIWHPLQGVAGGAGLIPLPLEGRG